MPAMAVPLPPDQAPRIDRGSQIRPEARVVREAAARSVCADCPVLLECRDWAREHREYGYWGGESEEERAAAGYRVDMPVGRVARYPRGNGTPVEPRISKIA